MREYRIISKGDKFYPQVRDVYKFLFIPIRFSWERIGHNAGGGYGLYSFKTFKYGESTIEFAEKTIKDYETSILNETPLIECVKLTQEEVLNRIVDHALKVRFKKKP